MDWQETKYTIVKYLVSFQGLYFYTTNIVNITEKYIFKIIHPPKGLLEELMSMNLHDYVTKTLAYIFLFKSAANNGSDEYMVLYDLETTNMSRFITSLVDGTTKCSYYTVHTYSSGQQVERVVETTKDTSTYIVVPATPKAKKKRWSSYREIIQAETDGNKTFKVITVEFTKVLFTKILSLKRDISTFFSQDEIHHIFKYIFVHVDDNTLLTYSVCMNLQDDPQIFYLLSDYGRKHLLLRRSKQACALKRCYDYSNALMKFREAVNATIVLFLTEGTMQRIKVCGKKKNRSATIKRIPLNGFKLDFLFECLEIGAIKSGDDFDTLYSTFMYNGYNSKLTIIVYKFLPFANIFNFILGAKNWKFEPSLLTPHHLWTQQHVECVTFEVFILVPTDDAEAHNSIHPLENIGRASFRVNFINSEPQPIYNAKICVLEHLNAHIYSIPENITNISCEYMILDYDFVFKKRFKNITFYNCTIMNECTVTFEEGYEQLMLNSTKGRLDLSGTAGFGIVNLNETNSALAFQKGNEHHSSLFSLKHACIDGNAVIGEQIDELLFCNVNFSETVTLKITSHHKRINIRESSGYFSLVGEFEGMLNLRFCSILEISTNEHGFKTLSLACRDITSNIKLADVYDTVILTDTNISKGFCFTVNKKCNELVVKYCSGDLDLSETDTLKSIEITFTNERFHRLNMKGPIDTTRLSVFEFSSDKTELSYLFKQFKRIQYLKIGQLTAPTQRMNLELNILRAYLTATPIFSSRSTNYSDESLSTVAYQFVAVNHEVTADRILTGIFCENVMSGVEVLEYEHIMMSGTNCEYLREMGNLKVFKASIEYLTSESLMCLPPSIQSLNIYDSQTSEDNYQLCLLALKHYPHLKILTINGEFFTNTSNFGLLPKTVEILAISYACQSAGTPVASSKKTELRELYVHITEQSIFNHDIGALDTNIAIFLQKIFVFIDQDNLKCLILSSVDDYCEVDPSTYAVLNRYDGRPGHGIGT